MELKKGFSIDMDAVENADANKEMYEFLQRIGVIEDPRNWGKVPSEEEEIIIAKAVQKLYELALKGQPGENEVLLRLTHRDLASMFHRYNISSTEFAEVYEKRHPKERAQWGNLNDVDVRNKIQQAGEEYGVNLCTGGIAPKPVKMNMFGHNLTLIQDGVRVDCGSFYDKEMVNKLVQLRATVKGNLNRVQYERFLFYMNGSVSYEGNLISGSTGDEFVQAWSKIQSA